MRRRLRFGETAVVLAALLVVSGLAGCSKGGVEPGEARLRVDGVARVEYAKGGFELFDKSVTLHEGDVVQAVEGTFVLELADGARLEGRVARQGVKSSRVLLSEPPELEAGELLAVSSDGTMIDAAGTRFVLADRDKGQTAVRLSRSLAVGVAAYQGSVTIDSAGQERSVPGLRQMEISALGRPPATARPLIYDETDPWDLRYLGDAIELGRQLDAFARAYTASLDDDEGRTVGFYQLVVPGLDDEGDFTADLLAHQSARRQGDLLIGTAISLLGEAASFSERWSEIFAFHDQGATWGLVALDQGVNRVPLVRTVEQALNASSYEFTAASGPTVSSGGPGTTAGQPGSGGAGSGIGVGGAGSGDSGAGAGPADSGAGTGGSGGTGAGGGSGSGGGGGSGSPTTAPRSPTTTTTPAAPTTTAPAAPPTTSQGALPDTGIPPIDDLLDPIDDILCGLLGCR